jgi:hypothetical protein
VERFHLTSAAALAVVFVLMRQPGAPAMFRAEYDRHAYPEAAAAAVAKLGPSARVFTTDVWGGYLIYRFYPAVKVFVDGRIDFYGPEHGQAVLDALAGKENWQQTLSRYGVTAALIPAEAPLAGVLKQSRNWEPVYGDGTVAMFRLREGS